MKNYFKKMSLLLAVSSTIALTSSVGAFAADNYITGVSNLNGTAQNSAKVLDNLLQPEKGWIRFNDDNSNIEYSKYWSHYRDFNKACDKQSTAKFNFIGNEIRIIGEIAGSNSWGDVYSEIWIDGNKYTFTQWTKQSLFRSCGIAFEKLDLSDGEHTVVITNPSNKSRLNIDAIDINEGGQLKPYSEEVTQIKTDAVVGDILLEPEAGWVRFNQNDSNIKYTGSINKLDKSNVLRAGGYSNGDFSNGNFNGDFVSLAGTTPSLQFNFVGNKIRIIGITGCNESSDIEISIDGKIQKFREDTFVGYKYAVLVFEDLDLENREHSVVIKNISDSKRFGIDAIDINEGGKLKLYADQVVTTTPAAVQLICK